MRQNATTGAPVRSEPKLGERLRVPSLVERRHREHLGGRDRSLATPAVDPHLEHQRAPRLARVLLEDRSQRAGEPQRLVVLALPDVAAEDQPGGAGLHRLARLLEHRVVAGLAAAGDQHQ